MKKVYKEGTIRDKELILGIDTYSVNRLKYFMDKDGVAVLTKQPSRYYSHLNYYVIRERLFGEAIDSKDIRCLGQPDLEDLNYVKGTDINKFNVFLLKIKMLYPELKIMTREEFKKKFDEFCNQNQFYRLKKLVQENPIRKEIEPSYFQTSTSNILFAEIKNGYYVLWYMRKDRTVYRLGLVRNLDKIDFNRLTASVFYFNSYVNSKYILLGEVK